MKDYKDTLNLPKTEFAMKANLPNKEPELLKYWEEIDLYTKLKEKGDEESMDHDKSFIEALEYGMPPACGFGVSERFFSFLMNRPIRECVIFPLMRPKK